MFVDFKRLFAWQRKENQTIRRNNPLGDNTVEEWTRQLLLGMSTEMSEMLSRIQWKVHVVDDKLISRDNVHREIIDLFKYVLSLAELWGMTAEDVLRMSGMKTRELKLKREFEAWEPGDTVLLLDMDGTIADWRTTFIQWVSGRGYDCNPDSGSQMAIEVDLGIPYDEYETLKWDFEAEGGYRTVAPIHENIHLVQEHIEAGYEIAVFTARPNDKFGRVWTDSYQWLVQHCTIPDYFAIGRDRRISFALRLKEKGTLVKMMDDDPTLAMRAAASGIQVYLIDQPYNQGIEHENIRRVMWND